LSPARTVGVASGVRQCKAHLIIDKKRACISCETLGSRGNIGLSGPCQGNIGEYWRFSIYAAKGISKIATKPILTRRK